MRLVWSLAVFHFQGAAKPSGYIWRRFWFQWIWEVRPGLWWRRRNGWGCLLWRAGALPGIDLHMVCGHLSVSAQTVSWYESLWPMRISSLSLRTVGWRSIHRVVALCCQLADEDMSEAGEISMRRARKKSKKARKKKSIFDVSSKMMSSMRVAF